MKKIILSAMILLGFFAWWGNGTIKQPAKGIEICQSGVFA